MADIVTLQDAVLDEQCKLYASMLITNPGELLTCHVETFQGSEFKTLLKTQNGDVEFRRINQTSGTTLPRYEVLRHSFSVTTPVLTIDQAAYDMAEHGGDVDTLPVRMKQDVIEGAMESLGKKVYYGDSSTDNSFDGFGKQVLSDLTFSAGGNTTNKQSSIWLVCWGPTQCMMAYGGGIGSPWIWSDWKDDTQYDANGKALPVYSCYMKMYPGLAVVNPVSIARVANVESIDDDKLYDAVAYCEEMGLYPTHMYMRPSVLASLRKSRTATNPTGLPAPVPTDAGGGIPIVKTLSIKNTEAVVSDISITL